MSGTEFVVGVDGGGTSTRAVAMSIGGERAGAVLGSGHSGGANPNAHPQHDAAAHVAEAVAAAMTGLDPSCGRAGVLGMAGDSKLTDPRVAEVFSAAWHSTGLLHEPVVLSDAEVAFASATSDPDGTALVAGTGAIAARIADHRLVRTAGGHGWLLGDEGSAFWIGREAVRSTLRTLDGAGSPTPLGRAVLTEAGIASGAGAASYAAARDTAHRLITAVNANAPVHLARFAPAVTGAAANGDTGAAAILNDAAAELTATAMAAREHGEATPVVLIGGLVEQDGPLTERIRAALSPQCGGEILLAGETAAGAGTMTAGAAGAAWLAALTVLGAAAPRPSH